MPKKFVSDFNVTENIALNETNSLIRLHTSVTLPQILPGQFVNVEIKLPESFTSSIFCF